MIYLICAKNNKQRLVELNDKDEIKSNIFYKFFVENFEHKNILYSLNFYNDVLKEIFPHRVNLIYTQNPNKRLPNVINAIVTNNIRDIIKSYKNDIDDLYVFATDIATIEEFSKLADYLLVFCSDAIGSTHQQLSDFIDFSNYNLIRYENPDETKYHIEYYVNNKIGK